MGLGSSGRDDGPKAGHDGAAEADGSVQVKGELAALPTLEEQIAELRQELLKKEEEARANFDLYMRERADLENYKKRARRDMEDRLRFATEPLVRELLPVVDNLERAVEHAAVGGNGKPLVEGVELVLRSLQDVLKRHGIQPLEVSPGEPFDPKVHEAVARQESDGEPNRIVTQHERGFLLHDRLLRPAKVVVSYKPEGDRPESSN